MYLLIDMSEFDQVHLALFDEQGRTDKIFESRNRELLFCIDEFIKSKVHKVKSLTDLKGIMVVVGSGSFTSERIGCVVANTFGYVRRIPLLAISVDDVDRVQELIPKLLKQPKGQFISATYSGEPNIGRKKLN
ncbi:MAG: hypothetical protein HYV41_05285 [Candidatus Magasanikbacteria bacterium]|nr:hypothetical protein [Candidatus Magasanikbacteria bacterium]